MSDIEYDYVIIGAGSAGCVLAARLSEDPNVRVLVLEAGGKNDSFVVRMPAGIGLLTYDKGPQNWGFWTEPEPGLNDRKVWWPRGRGLGGSSAINGMVYARGHPHDYDEWRQLGLPGWAYKDVLPYFRKMETHHGGKSEHHGGDGPLSISLGEGRSPFNDAFIRAGQEAGYPLSDDFNGAHQEGFGRYDLTINDGKRSSTAAAYLRPSLARENLTCITDARITRLLLEGKTITGAEYVQGKKVDGLRRSVRARETLLCAGAVHSPQILQVSGIGPAEHLKAINVPVAHDLPGVGANLQDHLDCILSWRSKDFVSIHSMTKGWRGPALGIRYALTGKGHGRQQFLESGAFIKTRPDLDRPDIQLHAVAAILPTPGEEPVAADGFSVHVCVLRPHSRGSVMAPSADPFAEPVIRANYLEDARDLDTLREGVKIVRHVISQSAMDPYRLAPVQPPMDIVSDNDINTWIRRVGESVYHPVGTCRMGRVEDDNAVVDETLCVRGLKGLRVVDASVMPTLIGSNTNAATIMIAEKAADMIAADQMAMA